MPRRAIGVIGVVVVALMAAAAATATSGHTQRGARAAQTSGSGHAATPIKHLVVIFQENISFDHYFGTYPKAANTSGQPFHGRRHARVNGLANTPGLGGVGT